MLGDHRVNHAVIAFCFLFGGGIGVGFLGAGHKLLERSFFDLLPVRELFAGMGEPMPFTDAPFF